MFKGLRNKYLHNFKKSVLKLGYFCAVASVVFLSQTSASLAISGVTAPGSPQGNQQSSSPGLTPATVPMGDNKAMFRCDRNPRGIVFGGNPRVAANPQLCKDLMYQFSLGLPMNENKDKSTAALVVLGQGDSSGGMQKASFKTDGSFKTWFESKQWLSAAVNRYLTNRADPFSQIGPLLTRSGKSAGGTPNTDANKDIDSSVYDTRENRVVTDSGQDRDPYSVVYNNNKEVITDGACQMIAKPGGPYFVKAKWDGSYEFSQGGAGGGTMGSGTGPDAKDAMASAQKTPEWQRATLRNLKPSKNKDLVGPLAADVEAIIDVTHPFSPRHYTSWQERTSPSMSDNIMYDSMNPDACITGSGQNMGGGSGGMQQANQASKQTEKSKCTYTWVCGHKKFPMAYMCIKEPKRDQAWVGGFDYYKQPMNKGGKILANDGTMSHPLSPQEDNNRHQKFQSYYKQKWWQYYMQCEMAKSYYCYTDCYAVATESAEHDACRTVILPPVTPINRLKMAYNLAPEGKPQAPSGGGSQPQQQQMPYIYEDNAWGSPNPQSSNMTASGAQLPSESMNWYFANPQNNFGYNMPPLKNWSTGLPGSLAAVKFQPAGTAYPPKPDPTGGKKPDKTLEKLTPWRMSIVGPNRDYMMNESNDMARNAHNMSGQHGAWEEFKLYQAHCAFYFGLNCVCNPELFDRGRLYALQQAGASLDLSNEKIITNKDINVSTPGIEQYNRQRAGTVMEDLTERMHFAWDVPYYTGDDFRKYGTIIGLSQFQDKSNGNSEPLRIWKDGVKTGDIIYWDDPFTKDAKGTLREPFGIAYVTEKRDDKEGCFIVKQDNIGMFNDTLMVNEGWGIVQERIWCPPPGKAKNASTGSSGDSKESGFTIEGVPLVGKYPPCSYVNIYKCTQENDWKIYDYQGTRTGKPDFRKYKSDSGKEMGV